MSFPRILASPLAGTAGVIAGLCLLAIPLHRLTSAPPAAAPSAVVPAANEEIPSVLRVKLLTPAKRLTVKTVDAKILLDMTDVPAGETERDTVLQLIDDAVELEVHADFENSSAETAVFLTVMPDGHEQRTGYMTGCKILQETLRFTWQAH